MLADLKIKGKILPCPYCGGNRLSIEYGGYIHCWTCGADGPVVELGQGRSAFELAVYEAIPAWNKRGA